MKLFVVVLCFFSFSLLAKDKTPAVVLPGLELTTYELPARSGKVKDVFSVLKINPKNFSMKLIAFGRDGQEFKDQQLPENVKLRKFLKKFLYNGLINASMFKKDYLTSVGYMRDGKYINNTVHDPKYSGLLVFNPKNTTLKNVDIIEKPKNSKWQDAIKDYDTVIENYRTISSRTVTWKPSDKRFTYMFQLGMDSQDNILFIGFESSQGLSVHEFSQKVLELPIDVQNAVYLDGGPHGILQVKTAKQDKEFGATYKAFSPNFLIIQKK